MRFYLFFLLFQLAFKGVTYSQSPHSTKTYDLVICAIFQDEAFFLKEWIEFHKLVGVQHFYLYNHLSTDQYQAILAPYIESGLVELFDWPVNTTNQQEYLSLLQLPAYNHALNLVKQTAHWAAFIDLDEFLIPVEKNDLKEVLKEYQDYGGVAINWQVYGTSNLTTLPHQQLITESLLWKADPEMPINKTVKLIVQPEAVKIISDPHFFTYEEGFFAINSSKQPLKEEQRWHPIKIDQLRINHYWFGTYEWFTQHKMPRRAKWGIKIVEDYLESLIELYNEVYDDIMLKFTPKLKEKMDFY